MEAYGSRYYHLSIQKQANFILLLKLNLFIIIASNWTLRALFLLTSISSSESRQFLSFSISVNFLFNFQQKNVEQFFRLKFSINLPWGHVSCFKKCGTDRPSRFDVFQIQPNRQVR